MDLEDEDWVNVPYDELLEVHHDEDDKFFSRKFATKSYKSGYFRIPKTSQDYVKDDPICENQLDHKEVIKLPILIGDSIETSGKAESKPKPDHDLEQESNSNQDPIFHVFFEKENQFVEMKMDSSRPSSQELGLSCIETAPFQHRKNGDHEVSCSSPSKMIKKEVVDWKYSNQIMNFWKWGLSGIGICCSVGMTAATICIIICGNGRKNKQNTKFRFQIHPDNKRIKQVMQKANEAMSAARGVPLVKAQITCGGHYESM
ncbi:hypothetical protein R6Q57_023944 [Mikania cordata]